MTPFPWPDEAAPNEPNPPSPPPRPASLAERLSDLAPSKVQILALVIGILAASNVALWIALQKTGDTRPVTVVAVRQMTQDYVRKITSPSLTEQQSVLRANLFVAAAQDELHRLVAPNHLVLARECVLSGAMNDITAALQQRVESRLAQEAPTLSDGSDASQTAELPTDPIIGARVSAAILLSPSAAESGQARP